MNRAAALALTLTAVTAAVLVAAPGTASAQAELQLQMDHAASSSDAGDGPSTTTLRFRGGWDFEVLRAGFEVPVGIFLVSEETDALSDEFVAGNMALTAHRLIGLGERARLDAGLRVYMPTLVDSGDGGKVALRSSAQDLRPEQLFYWLPETLSIGVSGKLSYRLVSWLELGTMTRLVQALPEDDAATFVHLSPELVGRIGGAGRLSVGYGFFDRLDGDKYKGRQWLDLMGGYDSGSVLVGLTVRLRQSPDEFADRFGTQFGVVLGGRINVK